MAVQFCSPEPGDGMRSYRGHCRNCDFTSAVTVGGRSALILDTASDDPGVDPVDPRLLLLDDQNGRETIARNGYSFVRATVSGRYLRVREFFCAQCGHLYQQRTLAPAFAWLFGRLWFLLALPFGVLFYALSPDRIAGVLNGILFGSIAGGATIALLDPLFCAFLRWQHATRVREFATQRDCPACGSRSKALPGICHGTIPCPNCKATTMSIDPVEDHGPLR